MTWCLQHEANIWATATLSIRRSDTPPAVCCKDGKVVKEGDDLMAATRYALMMLRHASTKAAYDSFRRPLQNPALGIV